MFKFRLEKVLQHRQRQVDAQARCVTLAEQALRRAEAAVGDASSAIRRHDAAAADARHGHLDPGGLQQQLAWRDQLVRARHQHETTRDEALDGLTRAQKDLQDAWREREVLERLRSKQYEDWKHEQARRQQQELDEVGSIRAAIGAAGGAWSHAVGDENTDGKRMS